MLGEERLIKSGRPIALNYNARPIFMRKIFHKFAFKYIFRLDVEDFKIHLFPHQLTITITGGPEILIPSARDWIAQNKRREDMILL